MNQEPHDGPVGFETRGTMQVAGLQITCHPSLLPNLLPPLWQTLTERLPSIAHTRPSDSLFKVRRQDGEEETHCLCVAVSSTKDLPVGIVSFEIPAQTYAIFRCAGGRADLAATYEQIERWLSAAEHYRRLPLPQAFPLEIYSSPPSGQFRCEVHIPIEHVIPALKELDYIDWSQVEGCYGPGDALSDWHREPASGQGTRNVIVSVGGQDDPRTSLPEMLRQLTSESAEQRQHAFAVLAYNLEHQFSLYSATAAAVPFLCKLLQEPAAPNKLKLLGLLTTFAQGYHIDQKLSRRPLLLFLLDENEEEGMEQTQEQVNWNERTHHAVREGITYVLPFLSSNNTRRCTAALRLLGCFKEERALIVPHLRTLLETTSHEDVVALTLQCLGALLTLTDDATTLLLPYLSADRPERLRLSAAIALCAVMKEHISEEMVEWIEQAALSPRALVHSREAEMEYHVEWLINQPNSLLALMSVVTPDYLFVPPPIQLPAQSQSIFADMPGVSSFFHEKIHYPAWFDHSYAEEAAVMLLRFCFPDGAIPVQTAFADLNKRQQRLLRMLAEHQIFWPDEQPYRVMEANRKRLQQFSEEVLAAIPGFTFFQRHSYEEELDASEVVQLLRKAGLPDTPQTLRRFVRS